MTPETLLEKTTKRFPRFATQDVVVHPLEKGGSDRNYYRIEAGDSHSLILVKYGDQREENRHYVSIAQFLADAGVNVPHIYYHDEKEGLIWMENLGDCDLWFFREEAWDVRFHLYKQALDQLFRLHCIPLQSVSGCSLKLEKEFNEELYFWEQNYFFENCLGRYFGLDEAVVRNLAGAETLKDIAKRLSLLPRTLVHRDFQSQNIMIREEQAYLIDFQGLRPGLPQYDLASLIYDPYVSLNENERAELLDYYMKSAGQENNADFEAVFDLCAMQRLMQALGAYGFLGLVKERPHFLDHIPAALNSLKTVSRRISGLQNLCAVLDDLPEK